MMHILLRNRPLRFVDTLLVCKNNTLHSDNDMSWTATKPEGRKERCYVEFESTHRQLTGFRLEYHV